MLNQVVLVGKVLYQVENEFGDYIKIAVERNYRNSYGEYEVDQFLIWSKNRLTEVQRDNLIGVKGRLEIDCDELLIVAEKVQILGL